MDQGSVIHQSRAGGKWICGWKWNGTRYVKSVDGRCGKIAALP